MDKKRSSYWKSKIDSSNDPKDLWRSIKSVLGGNNATPLDSGKSLSADDLAAFFVKKVDDIRASTNSAAPATFLTAGINCHLPVFDSVTVDELTWIVRSATTKQSCPTWLLKDCVDLLAPCLVTVFNRSLETGHFSSSYKDSLITPLLKNLVRIAARRQITDQSRIYQLFSSC